MIMGLCRWRVTLRRFACESVGYSVPQASTRSAAVLVKQFNASCFKRTSDCGGVRKRHCGLPVYSFRAMNCCMTDPLRLDEFCRRPTKKCSGGSNLSAGNGPGALLPALDIFSHMMIF